MWSSPARFLVEFFDNHGMLDAHLGRIDPTLLHEQVAAAIRRGIAEGGTAPNGETMAEVHARHGSRPASPSRVDELERRFGASLPTDGDFTVGASVRLEPAQKQQRARERRSWLDPLSPAA